VRAETLDAFSATLAGAGFRRDAFLPCYGLAEASLLVSGGPPSIGAVEHRVSPTAFDQGRLEPIDGPDREDRRLVSCGAVASNLEVAIAEPATGLRLPDGAIGEVWVRGPSVALGYWDNIDATEETFGQALGDETGAAWLRTGDLGALFDGRLVITGRRKDLLIVQGANIYPQDIEYWAERSHWALRPGACVAFSRDAAGDGDVVVVAELQPRTAVLLAAGGEAHAQRRDEIVLAIRAAVAEGAGVTLADVVLAPPRGVPRTSSGKLQRQLARQRYGLGGLERVDASPMPRRAASTDFV
jgi:acyl-CoA synthetase (AMP-forming)/AMP-acid ligase II